MEELFPKLRNLLNEAVEITEDNKQLLIELKVKKKIHISGDLGSPHEIEEMIRKFGGIKEDIQMEVNVDENTQIISLRFLKTEDYEVVNMSMKHIWDRATELLIKAFNTEPGKTNVFMDLGDFDENY